MSIKGQRQRIRRQIREMREEIEDLIDYLDLLEARVRNAGKPTVSHAEVLKKCGLKRTRKCRA